MKKKNTQGFVPEKWKLLTETIGQYSSLDFPKHQSVGIKGLRESVRHFVHHIPENGSWLIGFTGLPGVWKSHNVPSIHDAAQKELWFSDPQELVIYREPDGKILEVWGYVCATSSAVLMVLHADHFFGALGSDRRDVMLQDTQTCRKLWWNPRAALRFVRDIAAWNPTDVKIYLWTPEEKIQRRPWWTIEIKTPSNIESTRVTIAEWVNVGEWVDVIRKKTSVKTLKILYNTSFEDSLIRVLRRDHEKKGYSFQYILDHRLIEYCFILDLYIEPALNDQHTLLLEKKRIVPPFTRDEKSEILLALRNSRERLLQNSNLTPEQQSFIDTLSSGLVQRFERMQGLSWDELELWNTKKSLKKERKKIKARKKSQLPHHATKKEITDRIKEIKKTIREIKSRIESEKNTKISK